MSNFCDFIQIFVFTTNHHLKVCISQLDYSLQLIAPYVKIIHLEKKYYLTQPNISRA